MTRKEREIKRLRDELFSSEAGRFVHRVTAVVIYLDGATYAQTAKILGEKPRTVASWVKRYRENGIEGLRDKRRP